MRLPPLMRVSEIRGRRAGPMTLGRLLALVTLALKTILEMRYGAELAATRRGH